MSVVDFAAAKAEREPHWAGTCKCVGCGHEWDAVAPLGTLQLECPSCTLPKGYPKHPFGAAPGDAVFVCNHCDSEALTAYLREGRFHIICMGCGIDHTEAIYG
jgi:hypothetical protein